MYTVTFTAGELSDFFLLISPFEVELPDISTRWHLFFAQFDYIKPVGNLFPYGFISRKFISGLINIAQINGFTDSDSAGIRLFLSGNHLKQSSFAGTVRADNSDNCALWNFERQVFDQELIAEAF